MLWVTPDAMPHPPNLNTYLCFHSPLEFFSPSNFFSKIFLCYVNVLAE